MIRRVFISCLLARIKRLFDWVTKSIITQVRTELGNIQSTWFESFFWDCAAVELLDHDGFIDSLIKVIPHVKLPLTDSDCLSTFPITSRGIHIWMLLGPSPTPMLPSVWAFSNMYRSGIVELHFL